MPAIVGEWIRRLGYLLRRGAIEDELRREMESHRALMTEPKAFGNTLRLREEARDVWGLKWFDDLVQDLRFALRTLRHSLGFTLTAIVTLALGIGVNIGMLRLVNGLLLRPLYERPDQVVEVYSRSTAPTGGYRGVSYPNYLDLRDGTADTFSNLAACYPAVVGLDAGDGARRTLAFRVTATYFEVLGVPLARGRSFTSGDEQIGAAGAVVLSHRFWEQHGADPNVIGRIVYVDGDPFTVVGVAAKGFTGTSIPGPAVWLPAVPSGGAFGAPDVHVLGVVGRLRDGTSVQGAAPALAIVTRRLAQAFPSENAGYTLELSAPSRLMFMPGPGGAALTASLAVALMAMSAIVLLVACLNLADLLLARGQTRRREIAIRSSLGGGRGRLTRQLLTEALLLALAGGAVGLLLSTWATQALLTSLRPMIPVALTLPDFALDWRVLIGTVGFSLVASLLFGAWPAWALTGRAVATDLKRRGGDDGKRVGGVRIGNALVVVQVALSLLLLASGGLFLMSAISAATADPGFRLDGGLLVEIDPSLAGYDEARGRQVQRALLDRLRTVPGVAAATIGSDFPFTSFGDSRLVAPASPSRGSKDTTGGADARSQAVDAVFTVVGNDFARTLGLPMRGGRDFTDAELAPGSLPRVAIVDDALAERLWPGESALGRLIEFVNAKSPDVPPPILIVGIVPAVKHSLGTPRPFPHVYVPLGQHYERAMTLQLRIVDPRAEPTMLATVARVIRDVDERVPVLRLETWRQHLDTSPDIWIYRAGAGMFSAFGGIALLLAVIGVYGVKSYVVSRRTREFGIRIAIGAHPRAVLWQVLREGGRTTGVGIGIGLVLALGAGQLFQGLLYGVNAFEPIVLVTAPLILLASSLLASYIPALRATRVDPTVALRAE
jgi:predicted permease